MRVGGFIDECDLWMFCGASPTIKSDGVTRFVVANRRNGRMFWAWGNGRDLHVSGDRGGSS